MFYCKRLLIAASTALLVACGGGGGGGGGLGAGVGGTGITYGPISGFGSLVVNGTRYSNSSASYTGEVSGVNQLQVGMMVTIKHTNGTTATAIDYRDNVEGPIGSINLAGNSMTVLGLTCRSTTRRYSTTPLTCRR